MNIKGHLTRWIDTYTKMEKVEGQREGRKKGKEEEGAWEERKRRVLNKAASEEDCWMAERKA